MNILLIKQTSLGDVVHATAVLRSVRLAHPKASITMLTSTTAADVFRCSPDVDRLLTFDRYRIKSDWWRRPLWTLGHFRSTFRAVRDREFEIALDLQGSWKTVICLWAARANQRCVKGRWWFARRFHQPQLHAIAEMEGVLSLCGIEPRQHCSILPVIDADRQSMREVLDRFNVANQRVALFCPRTRWPTKNWPLANFVELVAKLDEDFFVIFTGSVEDQQPIAEALMALPQTRVTSLAGQLSLSEYFALVSMADLVLTGDSLPMHVASAYNRPVVALFGPTDEARVGPRSDHAVAVRAVTDCQRCYRRITCPRDCISQITSEQVSEAINQVLGCGCPSDMSCASTTPEGGSQ